MIFLTRSNRIWVIWNFRDFKDFGWISRFFLFWGKWKWEDFWSNCTPRVSQWSIIKYQFSGANRNQYGIKMKVTIYFLPTISGNTKHTVLYGNKRYYLTQYLTCMCIWFPCLQYHAQESSMHVKIHDHWLTYCSGILNYGP
jgi:hypothetical protein